MKGKIRKEKREIRQPGVTDISHVCIPSGDPQVATICTSESEC